MTGAQLPTVRSVITADTVHLHASDPDHCAENRTYLVNGMMFVPATKWWQCTRHRAGASAPDAIVIRATASNWSVGLSLALSPASAEMLAHSMLRDVAEIRAQADAAAATALHCIGARIAATPSDEPLRAASGTPGANAPGAAHPHSRTHRGHQPVAGVLGPQSPVARLRAATRRTVRDAARLLVGSDRAVARAAALFDGRGSTLAAFAGAALLCGTVAVIAGILHLVAGQ